MGHEISTTFPGLDTKPAIKATLACRLHSARNQIQSVRSNPHPFVNSRPIRDRGSHLSQFFVAMSPFVRSMFAALPAPMVDHASHRCSRTAAVGVGMERTNTRFTRHRLRTTRILSLRSDNKRKKATRALNRMAFARLSTWPSKDSVSARIVCGWSCLSRV